jgi:hypothetical protein
MTLFGRRVTLFGVHVTLSAFGVTLHVTPAADTGFHEHQDVSTLHPHSGRGRVQLAQPGEGSPSAVLQIL